MPVRVLVAAANAASIEPHLAEFAVKSVTEPPAIAASDVQPPEAIVVAANSLERLHSWAAALRSRFPLLPWIVVADSTALFRNAFEQGAANACPSSQLELLAPLITNVVKQHRKELEAAEVLRSAYALHEQSHALIENVLDIITVLDIKGSILYESPSIERVLGYNTEELIGANAFAYMHPLDIPKVIPVFMLGVATPGTPHSAKFRFKHKNGSWQYLEAVGKSVHGPEGIRVIVTSRKVTEHAQVVAALGETETRFQSVVEGLGEGLIIADPEGRILYANSRLSQLTGYTQEELLGSIGYKLLLPEAHWEAFRERRIQWLQGNPDEFELEIQHRKGRLIAVSATVSPYRDQDGAIVGTIAAITDITERKLAERKLSEALAELETQVGELSRAKLKAEEMSQLKSSFLANMSHEIRTPMNSILGFASVLREQLQNTDAEEYAVMIERSGLRLLSTINAILDLARIESGKFELLSQDLHVAREIHDVVRMLQPLAENKQLALRFSPSTRLQAAIMRIDPHAFSRVLTNVVSNGLKFTAQGYVEVIADIELATITSPAAGPDVNGALTVYVMDSGVGISEEFLPHVFDEFKQESSGWTRNFEGSGLGLAITKRLVHLMNGDISVTSSPGKGSTFKIWIPAHITLDRSVAEQEALAQHIARG